MTKKPGSRSNALVGFVDIFPSLCEACGIPLTEGLEGTSFMPLLDAPDPAVEDGRLQPVSAQRAGRGDPQENVNVAHQPENIALVTRFKEMLHAGWRAQAKVR